MQNNSRKMMTWGAIGAAAGMMIAPMTNSKTRKRVTRTARNAYFRVADMMQDVKGRR